MSGVATVSECEEKYPNQYKWMRSNRERVAAYARASYHRHKEARALNAKNWRTANKDYVKQKQREDKRKRKIEIIDFMGGCCSECGGTFHPSVYEFHHKDPQLKTRDPSKLLSLSMARIHKELENCVMLCENCHRMEHHKYDW